MSILTAQNRYESYIKIQQDKHILYAQVLEVLSKEDNLTAREIAGRIGRHTRQDIQPRLTELVKDFGLIEESGKKYDSSTKRNVTTYKLMEVESNDNK